MSSSSAFSWASLSRVRSMAPSSWRFLRSFGFFHILSVCARNLGLSAFCIVRELPSQLDSSMVKDTLSLIRVKETKRKVLEGLLLGKSHTRKVPLESKEFSIVDIAAWTRKVTGMNTTPQEIAPTSTTRRVPKPSENKSRKTTAPSIPMWSPTKVLTEPLRA